MNVRLVKCNSLDLNLFQIDWDLTFGVVFLNADKTVYARYGTRNSQKSDNDVSLGGLAATMRAVLDIHQNLESLRDSLAGKQPVSSDYQVPEDYPSLDHFKPELDYQGQVAKSCIHCHQVRDAKRLLYRDQGKPIPDNVLFSFPSPRVLGIVLDPDTAATLSGVEPDSIGSRAGLQAGDSIQSVNGQRVDSEADLRWMLHNLAPRRQEVRLRIERNASVKDLTMALPATWRQAMDFSWRPTSWDIRRMATGGVILKPLPADVRARLAIADGKMALRADHVGQYGHHARAKKAGIRKQDIIVSFDGKDDLMTEAEVFRHALQVKQPGDPVEIVYLRNGKRTTTRIDLQ